MVYRVPDASVKLAHLHAHAPLQLGVLCRHCKHRALIEQDTIDAHPGNARSLFDLRFRCKSCNQRGTGQDQFNLYLFHQQTETTDFLYGEENREP